CSRPRADAGAGVREAGRWGRSRARSRRDETGPGGGTEAEAHRADGGDVRERPPDHPTARHDGGGRRARAPDVGGEPRRGRRLTEPAKPPPVDPRPEATLTTRAPDAVRA